MCRSPTAGSDDSLHLEGCFEFLRRGWDPLSGIRPRRLTASSGGSSPRFRAVTRKSDVCRAARERQAPPHLVKVVIHCVTGATPPQEE